MTLEDFFTLTEMKDGLTAAARVQELLAVMKEKDDMVKNVSETTRQWVAVASSITATENKECLDLFIKLDGLFFINKWLKDAQIFANEESASFVEEAISALLQAVEKLTIDDEQLASSGIFITVKDLLSYKSPKVQDKARALSDSWKPNNSDIISMDVDAKKNSEHSESRVIVNDGSLARIPVDEKLNVSDGDIVTLSNGQEISHLTSGHADTKDESPDTVVSPVKLDSFVNDLSMMKEVLCSSDENLDSHIVVAPKQDASNVVSEKCELVSEETRDDTKLANLLDNVDKFAASASWGVSDERKILSGTYDTAVEEAVTHPDGSTYDACERMLVETNDTNGVVVTTNDPRFEDVGKDNSTNLEQGNGSILMETKEQETNESTLKEIDNDDEVKRQLKNKKKRSGKSNKFARLAKNSKNTDLIRQTANIEDGTFDALEVACLVANEVEKEVVNYNEQSGTSSSSYLSSSSSSERNSTGGITQPDSLKSITGEQDLEINGPIKESRTMENVSPEPSKNETNQGNHLQDMESSQLTDAIRDPDESDKEKRFPEFDLNQEFSSEDLDQSQVDAFSNPVSIVSAPKAVVGPGMLGGPLQFEGNLGWKGSAATSAFRPASPRHASDSERALSIGGLTSSGSRQKQDFLDFDLNVAGGDDKLTNNMSRGKEIQMPPVFPSGESSFESSSKQPKTLMFDLNQAEEDGNGNTSASQSSGGRLFGFDLLANHSNGNVPSLIQPLPLGPTSNSKVNSDTGQQDETVISILGTKVKRSTFPPQTSLPFQNGRASEPFMDNGNLLRGGPLMGFGPPVPYQQPPMYGYNGFAMGPPMSFSSAPIYGPTGPVPYMFDTRGVPLAPQMFGATSGVPSSYCQPSLAMNCADLNSGHSVDFGNRDPAFFRQLFLPGQSRQVDDQLRDSLRPSSSGGSSGKRKEAESGWELFPTNYKRHL